MATDRLRVLTLNIWNKQGPWDERLPVIRRLIDALDPDLVGLQEVLGLEGAKDQAQEIVDGRPYHAAFASAWHIGGGLHIGNAVLSSRFPIVTAQAFPLPAESGEETRQLLYCEIDSPFGRVPIFQHPPQLAASTTVTCGRRQVVAILDELQRLAPAGSFPPILVGDFNAEPESTEIRHLRGLATLRGRSVYFADCFGAVGEGAGYTFSRRNPFAAALGEPERRIDYIFAQGPDKQLRGRPLSARVVADEAEGGRFASDHFGVYAEISAQAQARQEGASG